MEALAALSLVCNVMTLVTFGRDVVDTYRRVAENASPEPGLENKLHDLSEFTAVLLLRCEEFDPVVKEGNQSNYSQTAARAKLREIALDLGSKSTQLYQTLIELRPRESKRKLFWSIQYTIKKSRKKSKICELQQAIESIQNRLSNEFLTRICSSVQASHAQSQKSFESLEDGIKLFVSRWANDQRDMAALIAEGTAEIKFLVAEKAKEVKVHIDDSQRLVKTHLDDSRRLAHEEKKIEAFLQTLAFPQMSLRENEIEDAKDDTAKWILAKPSPLPEWIDSKDPIIWITGKPGSGKSTIMKYLVHHGAQGMSEAFRLRGRALRFYLIEHGSSPLQKTLQGCLRTLLHQMLSADPSLIVDGRLAGLELGQKLTEADWTVTQLNDLLIALLRTVPYVCYIFLDGLDESEPREKRRLAGFVKHLGVIPGVKLCVSSRPESVFQSELGEFPTVPIHVINYMGISARIHSALKPLGSTIGDPEDRKYRALVGELTRKAEGVFLWVELALQSILDGIDNDDPWDILLQRTRMLEPDLYALYQKAWSRLNADRSLYRTKTADLFWIMLHGMKYYSHDDDGANNVVLVMLWIASTNSAELERLVKVKATLKTLLRTQRPEFKSGHFDWARVDVKPLLERFPRELFAVSGGLVDVKQHKVDFIHRSVREFLTGTPQGQDIVGHRNQSDIGLWQKALKAMWTDARISQYLPFHDEITRIRVMFLRLMGLLVALETMNKGDADAWKGVVSSMTAYIEENDCDANPIPFIAQCYGAFIRYEKWQDWWISLDCRAKSRVLHALCDNMSGTVQRTYEYSGVFLDQIGSNNDCAMRKKQAWKLGHSALQWMVQNGADPASQFQLARPLYVPTSLMRTYLASSSLANALISILGWHGSYQYQGNIMSWEEAFQCINILRFSGPGRRDILRLTTVPIMIRVRNKTGTHLNHRDLLGQAVTMTCSIAPHRYGTSEFFSEEKRGQDRYILGRIEGRSLLRLLAARAKNTNLIDLGKRLATESISGKPILDLMTPRATSKKQQVTKEPKVRVGGDRWLITDRERLIFCSSSESQQLLDWLISQGWWSNEHGEHGFSHPAKVGQLDSGERGQSILMRLLNRHESDDHIEYPFSCERPPGSILISPGTAALVRKPASIY